MIRRFVSSYGELAFVFAVGLLAQMELWIDSEWAADRDGLALVAVAMAAVLLLRLRAPLLTLVLQTGLLQVMLAVNSVERNDPMTLVLMLLVAVYSAGAHTRGRALLASALLALAVTAVAVIQDGESLNVSGFLFFGFLMLGPFLAGIVMRIRRERERLLVHERDTRARAAVLEERARIARELHDVVAHAISVIVLQARGARHELERDEDAARAAIDAIERTASQALGEMRRLLAILRADQDAGPMAPQPSIGQLDALAAQVREAGLPVDVSVEGAHRELSPGVEVSAYRIVQEALTNTLKHAGPARARVRVVYGEDALELEVADTGAGPSNGGVPGGHGLTGMRERVAVLGGELESAARPDGGFVVRAQLPL